MESGSAAGSCAATSGGRAASAAFIGRRLSLNLPPGYRFLPTNNELVVHYLRPKLAGYKPPLPIFFDEPVLDYHPEQLIAKYREHGEDRWFFFTKRERKHGDDKRPNRTTRSNGHWNASGSLKPIYADGALVGCVRTLVFYEASRKKKKKKVDITAAAASPEEDMGKTDWTMYEYENITSEAEFQAIRNGEGKIDELVLCTIQKKKQKKKHRERGKKEDEEVKGNKERRKKQDDQEGTPCAGNSKMKRSLVATPQQEQVEAPLGEEFVNTDPNMDMLHCPVTASSTLPTSFQEMMLMPAAGTQSSNVQPNDVMHQNISQPMDTMMLQGPTLQEHLPYEQSYPYIQHMQLNTMAPPKPYSYVLGPEYPNYGFSNGNHLLGTNMDYLMISRASQFPLQPSYGVGGSTTMQGTVMPSVSGKPFLPYET